MGLIINARSGGRNPRLPAGYVRVQWAGVKGAVTCGNVHEYSEDPGRRQSGSVCSGGGNESAFTPGMK